MITKYVMLLTAVAGLSLLSTGCAEESEPEMEALASQECNLDVNKDCRLSFSIVSTKEGRRCYVPSYIDTYVKKGNTLKFERVSGVRLSLEVSDASSLFTNTACTRRFGIPRSCKVEVPSSEAAQKEHKITVYDGATEIPPCARINIPAMIKRTEDVLNEPQ